jgi:transcriptional regulator with XRE-family HTH domain
MIGTTVDPNLARAIDAARKRNPKLTQLQLARVTGLSLNTVRAACQGLATTRTLNLLARHLGVTVDELRQRAPQAGEP